MSQFNSVVIIVSASLFVSSTCLDIHEPEYARTLPMYGHGQSDQYGYPYQPGMYHQGSALDTSYHTPLDYHYPQTYQNYGQMVRRSLPSLGIRQTPCQLAQQQQNAYRCYRSIPAPSIPLYPVCNIHDRATANSNEGIRMNLQPGRDSRNAMDLSKIEYIEDVTQQSPIISPNYLSNPTIKFSESKDEGATQQHRGTIIHDRLNRYENSNDSNREEENSNHNTGGFGEFNNTNILVDSVHAAESNEEKVYYPTGGQTYLSYIRPRRPLKNPAAASTDTSTSSEQLPIYAFVPKPISSDKTDVVDNPISPYKYLNSIQPADSLASLTKSSSSTNNKKQHPIYTPAIVQKNSTKHP